MKKLATLIVFIIMIFTGCSNKDKISVIYKFKKGQKFLSNVVSISTKHKENEKNTFEFDFETHYTDVIDNGDKVKMTYTFTSFKMDGNESMPTLPAVEGTLDKYGKMIDYQNAMLQNFQPTITLPSKPIAVGETWESLISVPVQGQNVPLLLDAKIEKLVDYENKKAIHITYSGTKDNIDISGSTYKAEIKGSMYFDNELGMYIKVNSSYLYYSKINNQWEHIMTIDVTTNFKKILQ